jgi:hypothetical protein
LERTRHNSTFIRSCVGEPLKRNVGLLQVPMKVFLLPLLFSYLVGCIGSAEQSSQSKTYAETRELFLKMERAHESKALKKLFEESAVRRLDLIQALYDPEQKVSLNAQTVIKYVGDPEALAGLEDWFAFRLKLKEGYWISPVENITQQRYLQGNKRELVAVILQNEFKGRKDGWGKMIGYEPTSKTALVEIVFGETFTEGWHVALREENG